MQLPTNLRASVSAGLRSRAISAAPTGLGCSCYPTQDSGGRPANHARRPPPSWANFSSCLRHLCCWHGFNLHITWHSAQISTLKTSTREYRYLWVIARAQAWGMEINRSSSPQNGRKNCYRGTKPDLSRSVATSERSFAPFRGSGSTIPLSPGSRLVPPSGNLAPAWRAF